MARYRMSCTLWEWGGLRVDLTLLPAERVTASA